jgi:hypothetical protein
MITCLLFALASAGSDSLAETVCLPGLHDVGVMINRRDLIRPGMSEPTVREILGEPSSDVMLPSNGLALRVVEYKYLGIGITFLHHKVFSISDIGFSSGQTRSSLEKE